MISLFSALPVCCLGFGHGEQVTGNQFILFVGQDEGCQVHLLIFIARRDRVHSLVRWRMDKQCDPCLGLSRCYKWIMKLLPATIALGALGFVLISLHAPADVTVQVTHFEERKIGCSLRTRQGGGDINGVCHISVETQRRECSCFIGKSGDLPVFDIDYWRMNQNS